MLSMRSSASAWSGDGEPVRAYPACFAFRVVAVFGGKVELTQQTLLPAIPQRSLVAQMSATVRHTR